MFFVMTDLQRSELRVLLMLGPVNAAISENHQPDDDRSIPTIPTGFI